tara:strand:- start:489 stop:2213 length:1725 start_codon:yes stop_codon:yes gene_type:complete
MEMSIESALQKAIVFHKNGKLQEAENLYRVILEHQPLDPDANHNLGLIAISLNQFKDALPLIKIALETNPKQQQFWFSYINCLIKEKKFDNAKQIIEQAKKEGLDKKKLHSLEIQITQVGENKKKKVNKKIAKNTDSSKKNINKLLKFFEEKKFSEAEKLGVSITKDFPESLNAWKVLVSLYKQTNRIPEALIAQQKIVALSPNDHKALNNLGVFLIDSGKLEESISIFKRVIKLKPDYIKGHSHLGNILNDLKRFDESIKPFKNAIKLKPDDPILRMNLNYAITSSVPAWHLTMMNDEIRNNAYFEAIKLATKDNPLVLDIGTGSGLLSMMAVSNGAEKVITCETSKTIADVAKKIILKNGYEKNINVINKKSTDLIIGEDLPKTADLIISEVLSAGFVGEGARTTILDAKKRLLKKNGKMIPESGSIRISLLGNNSEVFESVAVENTHGFDLSEFKSISPNKFSLRLKEKPIILSNPENAFDINFFDEKEITNEEKIIHLKVNKDGLCLGLIQWLKVRLYKEIEYENIPGKNSSHWPTPVYTFDKPLKVKIGDILQIKAFLGEDRLWFHHLK